MTFTFNLVVRYMIVQTKVDFTTPYGYQFDALEEDVPALVVPPIPGRQSAGNDATLIPYRGGVLACFHQESQDCQLWVPGQAYWTKVSFSAFFMSSEAMK